MSLHVRKFMYAGLVAALVATAGCQSLPTDWHSEVRGSIDSNLTRPAAAVPEDVSKALLPPLEVTLPDGKVASTEPRFDLSVSNAPARQVFMGLVEGTRYDIVLHPSVS